ncbi:MAG: NDP-sugar synthase [Actinomycetota bacterium]|nr:NDP-sugar synthase [Actinomycetota bacterium]
MQALVLVGGEGTRLRPLTLTRPKPAVPLVDRPFIRFMADWLGRHGISDVVMACGFRAEDLRSSLGDEIPGGPRVRYVEESEPLGTAGPIRLAADEGFLSDRFLVLNGDVLTDLDLTEHMRVHSERGALASLALYPVDDPTSYGLVRKDAETGAVTEFLEKPDPAEIDTDEVNAGAYVLERSVVDLIPRGRSVSIEREIFPRLVGQGLFGLRLEGYWMDIGTPERYLQASWDILSGRVETEVAEKLSADAIGVADDAEVDGSAHLEGPLLIEPGASVGPGAQLGPNTVIGRDCEIGEGAVVVGSVLHGGCLVGRGARVEGSILAEGVKVGAEAILEDGSIAGEGARIEPGARLEHDARVEPGMVQA